MNYDYCDYLLLLWLMRILVTIYFVLGLGMICSGCWMILVGCTAELRKAFLNFFKKCCLTAPMYGPMASIANGQQASYNPSNACPFLGFLRGQVCVVAAYHRAGGQEKTNQLLSVWRWRMAQVILSIVP